jgi:MFS family permease
MRDIARQNFLSLYLPAATMALATGIAAPAIPVYAKSFDVSFETASLVFTAQLAGTTVSTIPTGYLLDRVGRGRILLAGPLILALSSFLTAFAQSFPELLIYRFLAGWAQQMWSVSRLAIIADTGEAGQRGRQITGMFTMENTGRMLGPMVGGMLAALYDMRAPFILHGVLSILVIIPSIRLARESAAHSKARAEAGIGVSTRAGLAALMTLPVIMFLIAYFLTSFARGPMFSGALFLYPVYYYGVGPGEIGVIDTIASIIGIPIMLMAGHVMDRYGRKATIVPGFAMLAVALTLTALTSWAGMPFPAFVVAYLLVMASVSVTSGNMQTLGADIVPERGRGVFLGVWMLIGQLAMTIAPWAMGALSAGYSYAVAFLAFAVSSAAVAVIVGTQVPETVRGAAPVKSSA